MAELTYPIDNREAYQSRIRFVVKTAKPLTETIDSILSAPPPPAAPLTSDPSVEVDQQRAEFDQAQQREIEKAIQIGPVYENAPDEGIVKLFTPVAIQFNDQLDYNNVDLGVLGANIAGGLAGGQSIARSALGALGNAGTSFMDVFRRRDIDFGEEAGRVAAARFTTGLVGGATRLTVQATTNPNTRLLFNKPILRNFRFAFKMIPNSREESEAIEAIVKHFRKQAYPKLIASNAGYQFPNAFGITIHHKDTSAAKMQKVPDCFLANVDITYNSTSGVFHEDGYPSEVDLNLQFLEMRALSQQDVEKGF